MTADNHREIIAGLFEQTMYVPHRKGRELLLKHILIWCVRCVLLMIRHHNHYRPSASFDRLGFGPHCAFLQQLDQDAYSYVVDELQASWLDAPCREPAFAVLQKVRDAENVFTS